MMEAEIVLIKKLLKMILRKRWEMESKSVSIFKK
jgi:hypothetical protein